MREAARNLASLGRYGDDTLLHVSRKELEGIRALTGKGFTRNPDTGLPEAFNWSSIIPIAAGIAGTVLSGGNVGIGALASGAASAATTAAEGGTVQDALTQGLISGATSYAGGQLLSGVGEAATQAASQGISQGVTQGATDAATQAATQGATEAATQAATQGAAQNAAAASPSSLASFGPNMSPQMALDFSATGTASPSVFQRAAALPTYAADFGQTLSNVASEPGAALSKLGSNIVARPMSAAIAAGGTLMQANDMLSGQPAMPGEEAYDPNRYPEQFPLNPRSWNAPSPNYRPGLNPEYRYFAEGGLASLRQDGGYTSNLMNEAKAALLGEHPRPREAIERFRDVFGDDALALLRDRTSGGRVRGAGGGMDDLVPGSIEGRQKVRLADGEFVIPADVVSGLGDGSTDQGVRKLHGLMNQVRQQRTGKKAQPKAIGGKITL